MLNDIPHNRLITTTLVMLLGLTSYQNNGYILGIIAIIGIMIAKDKQRVIIQTLKAFFLFTGMSLLSLGVMLWWKEVILPWESLGVFALRGWILTLLTLAYTNRFGVIRLLGMTPALKIFTLLLMTKIDKFTLLMHQSHEVAQSRGLYVGGKKELWGRVISGLALVAFAKGLEWSYLNGLSLRSRGYRL